jgi:hypothetical protein
MAAHRIDVHHHIFPPACADWLVSAGVRDAGGRALPPWSVEGALELMGSHGIASAVAAIDRGNAAVLFPVLAEQEVP